MSYSVHLPLNDLRANTASAASFPLLDTACGSLTVASLPVSRCRNPRVMPVPVRQVTVVFDPLDVAADATLWNRWLPASDLADATPMRRFEFLVGRTCAAEAMRAVGRANEPILRRRVNGTPAWPTGITGSITRTIGFVSVAVAPTRSVGRVGIDSEEILSAERALRVAAVFATPSEVEAAQDAGLDRETAITLIFSAKEALFKCLHASIRPMVDFHDLRLTEVNEEHREFKVAMMNTVAAEFAPGSMLTGRFDVDSRRVHTGVTVSTQ